MRTEDSRAKGFFRFAIAAYAFTLVPAMYFLTQDPTGDIKALLTRWAGFLICGGWLIVSSQARIPLRRPRVFPEMLAGLLLFYVIATLRSEYRMFSVIEVARWGSLAALYFTASQVYHTPAQVRRLFWTICAAMALSSTYGFMQAAGMDPFPWVGRDTDVYTGLPATFGNPNFAADTLILTITMALYLAWQGFADRKRSKEGGSRKRSSYAWLFGLWLTIYYAFHLHATHQRAGLVALAAATVLLILAATVGRRFRRPVAGMVTTLLLLGLVAVGGLAGVMEWSHARTGRYFPLDTSLLLRYQSYVSASDMVLDAPLLGHGPGVYKFTYPAYWTRFEQEWFAQEFRKNDHVHNDILETAIDAGLPAAGFYLAILVLGMCYGLIMAFQGNPERRRLGYALAALFCAFLVDGLFGFNVRVPVSASILFLLMGVLDGLWSPPGEQATQTSTGAGRTLRWAAMALLLAGALLESSAYAGKVALCEGIRMEGRPQRADRILARAQALAPWNPVIARERGRIALLNGDADQARARYEQALALDPHHLPTHLPLAHLELQRAIRAFEEHPSDIEAPLRYLEEASSHARRVLDICPMHPMARDFLGRITATRATVLDSVDTPEGRREARLQWKLAERQLTRAIQLGAENQAELHELVARVRMALGDTDGVEEAFVRAAQTDLSRTETWPPFLAFAAESRRFDRLRKALEDQVSRLEEEKDVPVSVLVDTRLYLASVLESGYRDLDGASRIYRAAAALQPERAEVWANYARFAQRHQMTGALAASIMESCDTLKDRGKTPLPQVAAVDAVLRRGWDALPKASFVLLGALRTYRATAGTTASEAFGWALGMLDGAASKAPDSKSVCASFLDLAMAHAHLNHLDDADRLFRKADSCLKDDSRGPLAVQWADVLVKMGRQAEAAALLQRTRKELPKNLEVRWALARCLARDGRLDEARREYELLLEERELDPRGREMIEKERAQL